MAIIIARVSDYDISNIHIGGKVIFVPPEKRNAAKNNFPPGSVAKVMVDNGTASSIVPPTESELAAFTRSEQEGNNKPSPEVKPVTRAVQPMPDKEAVRDAPATLTPSQRELADIIIEIIREDPQIRVLIERIAAKVRFEKINRSGDE